MSTALNPGRSLACHRLSLGKMGRSCDNRDPRRKLNIAQGTLKKGLLPEDGQGSGIRGEFEAPRGRQQREAVATGKVGRGRRRNGCDRSTGRAGAGVRAVWTGGMQLPPETPCRSKELKSPPLGPGTSQLMGSGHRTVSQHLCPRIPQQTSPHLIVHLRSQTGSLSIRFSILHSILEHKPGFSQKGRHEGRALCVANL